MIRMGKIKWLRKSQIVFLQKVTQKFVRFKVFRWILPKIWRVWMFCNSLPEVEARTGQRVLIIKKNARSSYCGLMEVTADWGDINFRIATDAGTSERFLPGLHDYYKLYILETDWLDNPTGRINL